MSDDRRYVEGEPDDTPDVGPTCEAVHSDGYFCTRERNHGGNHAAGNDETIVAVWD